MLDYSWIIIRLKRECIITKVQTAGRDLDLLARSYSLAEELANSITHGFGALLSVAGLTVLVTYASQQQDVWRIVSCSIYGATLVMLFLSSTLYHSVQHEVTKKIFQLCDHCSIYLLIAGTYTPFLLVNMRDTVVGWIMFGIIWFLAVSGIVFKIYCGPKYKKFSVATYILMGWLLLLASRELANNLSIAGIYWLMAGGLAYTVGAVFYLLKNIPFNHAIWHLFVLVGSALHFFAVLFHVLPV